MVGPAHATMFLAYSKVDVGSPLDFRQKPSHPKKDKPAKDKVMEVRDLFRRLM